MRSSKALKSLLQKMYDECNWYGYATRKGKRYFSYGICKIAHRIGYNLSYTPAQ